MFRKFLLASTLAMAVSAPAISAHAQAAGPYNWTGVYVGVNLGGAWTTSCSSLVASAPDGAATFTGGNCPSDGRFIGGGQVGYNFQMGNVVLGLEGDVGGATSGSQNIVRTTSGTDEIPGGTYIGSGTQTPGVISTIRARVGYAFDRTLVYFTGGGAFAGSSGSGSITYTPTGDTAPTATFTGGGSGTRSGWTLGGGLEYAVTPHWTIKAEDLYANFGNISNPPRNCADVDGGETCALFSNVTFKSAGNAGNTNIFRVGVNYKF